MRSRGHAVPKQYLPLAGQPMIRHALATLCATPAIDHVFVVLAPDDSHWPAAAMAELGPKLRVLRCGGDTRAQSVANGLRAMAGELGGEIEIGDDWVLVHDAARPCLTVAMVENLIAAVGADDAGGLLAVPVADTLKRADENGRVLQTVPREGLWQAQTPQMFRHRLLLDALDFAPQVTRRGQRHRDPGAAAAPGGGRCRQPEGHVSVRSAACRVDSAESGRRPVRNEPGRRAP
jgi:2-C-methyl-D-erythritol 4-phosphate cytidylyltransferase